MKEKLQTGLKGADGLRIRTALIGHTGTIIGGKEFLITRPLWFIFGSHALIIMTGCKNRVRILLVRTSQVGRSHTEQAIALGRRPAPKTSGGIRSA